MSTRGARLQRTPTLGRPTLQRKWPFGRKDRAVALEMFDAEAFENARAHPEGRACCAPESCDAPDSAGDGVPTSFELTIAADRERSNVVKGLLTGGVGHTWVKFSTDTGLESSYGLWPKRGFNKFLPSKTVAGCIMHPDRSHDGVRATDLKQISYTLKEEDWESARQFAAAECKRSPAYNLFTSNCTTFAVQVARHAGVAPPPSTWMAIHNPNTIHQGDCN